MGDTNSGHGRDRGHHRGSSWAGLALLCPAQGSRDPSRELSGVDVTLCSRNLFRNIHPGLCSTALSCHQLLTPSLPSHLTGETRKAQRPEVAFMFPTPHLIVVTPWAHFVLHLIPFERGHWRIAGEAGERSGGAAGDAERHTNKQKKIVPQGEIASTAAGL